MRQEYSHSFLQAVLDQYADLGIVKKSSLFTSGYENSNHYVQTDHGTFVIKIFEGPLIKPENVEFELEVIDYCNTHGLKVPKVYKNKLGNLDTLFQDKHVMVMEFVSGENMDRKPLADKLVVSLAEEAAKMDNALSHFKEGSKTRQNYEWDMKNTLLLEKAVDMLPETYDKAPINQVFADFRKIKPLFDTLPTGLIHNDVVPHNLIVEDGQLKSIIDFSDMAFSPYIQNVAVSLHLVAFAHNWNLDQAKLFVQHYSKIHRLNEQELSVLYPLIKARLVAFIIEFNRWNVIYEFDEHRAKTVEEHYHFLEKFIELGEEKFNQIIN